MTSGLAPAILLFFKAYFLGLVVVIPVGPVALLVMQRSLNVGYLRGLASGLGAAMADGLYGLLAAIGLATLIQNLELSRHFLRPLGSLALVIIGIYFIFRKKLPIKTEEVLSSQYLRDYLWDIVSAFFLTLLNPMTIIAFAALFVGSDLIPEDPKQIDYLVVGSGVFGGSLSWWTLMAGAAQSLRRRISAGLIHHILQVIGMILIVLALVSFIPRIGTLIDKIGLLMSRIGS